MYVKKNKQIKWMHIFCSNYHKQIAYENLKDVSLFRIRKYIYIHVEFYFNNEMMMGASN